MRRPHGYYSSELRFKPFSVKIRLNVQLGELHRKESAQKRIKSADHAPECAAEHSCMRRVSRTVHNGNLYFGKLNTSAERYCKRVSNVLVQPVAVLYLPQPFKQTLGGVAFILRVFSRAAVCIFGGVAAVFVFVAVVVFIVFVAIAIVIFINVAAFVSVFACLGAALRVLNII